MITSFADEATTDLFSGINSRHARRFLQALWTVIPKRLIALNAATRIEDVAAVGGHRFEYLKGDRAGTCSIRVNEQYRITFEFVKGVTPTMCAAKTTTAKKSPSIAPKPMARRPTHPGEILADMLEDRELSVAEAARQMSNIPNQRVHDLIKGRRGVTADTALLLSALLGTSPEFWLNLQNAVDLWDARQVRKAS